MTIKRLLCYWYVRLFGWSSISDMFEADAEMSKLKYLPGIEDMMERYRTHVQAVAESFRSTGLTNATKKDEQVGAVITQYFTPR